MALSKKKTERVYHKDVAIIMYYLGPKKEVLGGAGKSKHDLGQSDILVERM